MFASCRFCQRPTDKWQDFCNDCATSGPRTESFMRPRLRVIQGGRREWERPGRESRKEYRWLQAVTKPPTASV